MSKKVKLKYGMAKIQFIACQDRILELQKAGYNVRAIYSRLLESNLITMSYNAFHRNIKLLTPHVSRKRISILNDDYVVKPCSLSQQRSITALPTRISPISVSTKPAGKILSIDDIVSEKKADRRNFSEQQLLSNEELNGQENQIDLLVGQEK